MKYDNSIRNILSVALLAACPLLSCTEDAMDKVNENPNNPHDVPAKFILSDVGVSTGFNTVGGDFSLYSSVYMEHEVGTGQQQWRAETRSGEPASSTTYNNAWLGVYSNIKNAKVVIEKCQASSEDQGNVVTEAIAHILLAYNGAVLTDLFGDTPFSQTGIMNADGTPMYMQPKIDTQESIYTEIMSHLDEAISLLDEGNARDEGLSGAIGSKDYIYGGNAEKWLKTAYALKARYTLHLLNRSQDVSADLSKILSYAEKSFASADEECKLFVYDGNSQLNPLFSFNYSRPGSLSASRSLVNKFAERNDPRLAQVFLDNAGMAQIQPADIVAAPNGTALESASTYSISMPGFAITAPTQLISYHELLFIKAEALARLNDNRAKSVLKDAIKAAFANLEETLYSANDNWVGDPNAVINLTSQTDNYFSNEVESRFNASPVKEIIMQKYLAFFGASGESVEAYNDYRRLKAEGNGYEVTLENPKNDNQFPQRFGYGSSDVTANAEVKAAFGDGSYVYSEPVWWANGSR